MGSLSSILLSGPEPEAVVNDLASALEAHIAKLSGLKGMAARAGYGAVKSAKPQIASNAVRNLLPDISRALEPLYQEFRTGHSGDFGAFLGQHSARATQLVMSTVDARLAKGENSTPKKLYHQFKGLAETELKALLPSLGQVIARHAQRA